MMNFLNNDVIIIEDRNDLIDLLDDRCIEDFEKAIRDKKNTYTREEFLNKKDIEYPFILIEGDAKNIIFNMYSRNVTRAIIQDEIDELQAVIDSYKAILDRG